MLVSTGLVRRNPSTGVVYTLKKMSLEVKLNFFWACCVPSLSIKHLPTDLWHASRSWSTTYFEQRSYYTGNGFRNSLSWPEKDLKHTSWHSRNIWAFFFPSCEKQAGVAVVAAIYLKSNIKIFGIFPRRKFLHDAMNGHVMLAEVLGELLLRTMLSV